MVSSLQGRPPLCRAASSASRVSVTQWLIFRRLAARIGFHHGLRAPFMRLRVPPPRNIRRLLGAGGIGLAVLVWWIATVGSPEARFVSPVILPSPREVVASFPSLLTERALLESIAATLRRVLIGFGLAALVGVPLGIIAGSWRVVEAAGHPVALFGRNLPVAALIPLTILWFGIDETQKVMFIF